MEVDKQPAANVPEDEEKWEGDEESPEEPPPELMVFGVSVQRLQTAASVLAVAAVGILAFVLLQSRPKTAQLQAECDTEGCRELRLFLSSTINKSADPCRDFFQFTCAAKLKKERMSMMNDVVTAKVLSTVLAASVPERGQTAFQKAVALYRACVSLYSSKRSEAPHLLDFLSRLGLRPSAVELSRDPLDSMVQLNLAWGLSAIVAISEAAGSRLDYPHEMLFSDEESEWYQERQDHLENKTYAGFVENVLRFVIPEIDQPFIEELRQNVTDTETKVVNFILGVFEEINKENEDYNYLIRVEDVPKYLNYVVTDDQWEKMVMSHSEHTYRMSDQMVLEPLGAKLIVFLLKEVHRTDALHLISWSVLRQMAPYADGTAHGGSPSKTHDFCYEDVGEVLEAALVSEAIYKRKHTCSPEPRMHRTYLSDAILVKTLRPATFLQRIDRCGTLLRNSPLTILRTLEHLPLSQAIFKGSIFGLVDSMCVDMSYLNDIWQAGLVTLAPAEETALEVHGKVATPEVLREVKYIGYHVHKTVETTVGMSNWFPVSSRRSARRKAETMRLIIAYPFNLTRLDALERFYADMPDVPVRGGSFVLSRLNASRFVRRVQIRHEDEILFTLGSVNAQHTYSTNTVNVAGALLQPVLYFHGAPAGFNYGGIGQIMGHEMMHAFDVTGRNYDERGAQSNWWPAETTDRYVEQTQCLRLAHREALRKRALVLDPRLDSEDLADVMGTRAAFDALRNMSGKTTNPKHGFRAARALDAAAGVVDGFTELQLFFLGHCAKMCDPTVPPRERDTRESYAPNWARCVVPLMNMPEFSEAFSCATGAFMNPERKCRFW